MPSFLPKKQNHRNALLHEALAVAAMTNRTVVLPTSWAWCDYDHTPHVLEASAGGERRRGGGACKPAVRAHAGRAGRGSIPAGAGWRRGECLLGCQAGGVRAGQRARQRSCRPGAPGPLPRPQTCRIRGTEGMHLPFQAPADFIYHTTVGSLSARLLRPPRPCAPAPRHSAARLLRERRRLQR